MDDVIQDIKNSYEDWKLAQIENELISALVLVEIKRLYLSRDDWDAASRAGFDAAGIH